VLLNIADWYAARKKTASWATLCRAYGAECEVE